MRDKNSYYQRVYELVQKIPTGRVTTYGAIAKALGLKSGARMVGWALNGITESDQQIPAHRVVNRLGCLSGRHAFQGDSMKERLESEGVLVDSDYKLELETYFWNPEEITI